METYSHCEAQSEFWENVAQYKLMEELMSQLFKISTTVCSCSTIYSVGAKDKLH